MHDTKKILVVFGTRPEAIKLAPLVLKLKELRRFDVKVCVTAQHRLMLDQVLSFFQIAPYFDLNIMQPGQTLFDVTANGLKSMEVVLEKFTPDLLIVQGDTTSSLVGALSAYYRRIRVAHVEAGLRSGDRYSPYPEEMNRVLTGKLADIHFTPTKLATENLKKENIRDHVYEVGNTVIDALFLGLELIKKQGEEKYQSFFRTVDFHKKIVLITGHRRESFGKPFENICTAIQRCAEKFPDTHFIYPVHLNPNVMEPVRRMLGQQPNIHLMEPLDYDHFIWLMNRCYLVLTDSGGLQEEAPSLGKPVLVMRDVTERKEGLDAGTARLTGTDPEIIFRELSTLLTDGQAYHRMAKAVNPYGDGKACERIVKVISEILP